MQRMAQKEPAHPAAVLTANVGAAEEEVNEDECGVVVHELEVTPAVKPKQPIRSVEKSKVPVKPPQKQPPPRTFTEHRQQQSQEKKTAEQAEGFKRRGCKFCGKEHLTHLCPMPNKERREVIKKLKLCFNCFETHHVFDCAQHNNCRNQTCRQLEGTKRHHTFICTRNQNQKGHMERQNDGNQRSTRRSRSRERRDDRRQSSQRRETRRNRRSRSYSPHRRRDDREERSSRCDTRRERSRSRSSRRRHARSPQHRSAEKTTKTVEEPFAQCVNQLLMLVKNPILSAALSAPGAAAANAHIADAS